MECLQVTGFCVQEFLISSVYIWEAVKLLQFGPEMHNRGQTVMYQLVAINLVIILMDAGLLVLQYLGHYYLKFGFISSAASTMLA